MWSVRSGLIMVTASERFETANPTFVLGPGGSSRGNKWPLPIRMNAQCGRAGNTCDKKGFPSSSQVFRSRSGASERATCDFRDQRVPVAWCGGSRLSSTKAKWPWTASPASARVSRAAVVLVVHERTRDTRARAASNRARYKGGWRCGSKKPDPEAETPKRWAPLSDSPAPEAFSLSP